MKRFGAVLLAALLLLGLPSCGTGETSTPADASAAAQKSTPTPEISADAPALTAGCEEFSGVFSPFFAETILPTHCWKSRPRLRWSTASKQVSSSWKPFRTDVLNAPPVFMLIKATASCWWTITPLYIA